MTNVLLFGIFCVNCLSYLTFVVLLKYFKVIDDDEEENDIYDK